MRINYVLIDFEKVQPESVELLAPDHFQLIVFVGKNQTKLPFAIASSVQRLGTSARYIKICGNGSNALDFHIAYYIGQLAATDPSAYFHIVSRDTGFDPLIEHLRSSNVLVDRVISIGDIPLLKASNARSVDERLAVALARLEAMKLSRPRTVRTLQGTIASAFQKTLSDKEVARLVRELTDAGHVAIAGDKVSYPELVDA